MTTLDSASTFQIRPIQSRDDAAMASVIRKVMPEFGADGPGFAIHDPEVDHLSVAYSRPHHAYFVLDRGGEVLGGGGIAPLEGGSPNICELRKMYLLPRARGIGAGMAMLQRCLNAAREAGFHQCYLETLTGMEAATALYLRSGFRKIDKPLGQTGHFSCDRFFLLDL